MNRVWVTLLLFLQTSQCFNILEAAGLLVPEEPEYERVMPSMIRRKDEEDSNNDIHSNDQNDSEQTNTTSKSTSARSTSSISINPALPAGGVNLQTPVSTSTTYVKSGDKITFGWNYTSLYITPSAINVEVSCSQNSQVYTLARNQSVKSTSIVWDTNDAGKDNGLHLISADYTLKIYDSSKKPSDIASAGKLGAFEYTFSIYIPKKYTPWPQGAKYVNISVRATPPLCLTAVFVLFVSFIGYLA